VILVDTSVLIDFFKGNKNKATSTFRTILEEEIPFGITSVVYQEVLQGAKTEKDFVLLRDYLSAQRFFHPKDPVESYTQAAHMYFLCRKKGVTIRSTIDCLIAQICIEHDLDLLHNDRDFEALSKVVNLKILRI